MRRYILLVVTLSAVTGRGALMGQVPPDFERIASGELVGSHQDTLRIPLERFRPAQQPGSIDVLVIVMAPEDGDLDLAVRTPEMPPASECASNGVGEIESCGIHATGDIDNVIVRLYLFEGEGRTAYQAFARWTVGPRLGESAYYAGAAIELMEGEALRDSVAPEGEEVYRDGDVFGRSYRLPVPAGGSADSARINVTVSDTLAALDAQFYDENGAPEGAPHHLNVRASRAALSVPPLARYLTVEPPPVSVRERQRRAPVWELLYRPPDAPRSVQLVDRGWTASSTTRRDYEFTLPANTVASIVAIGGGTRISAVVNGRRIADFGLRGLEERYRIVHVGDRHPDVPGLTGPFSSDHVVLLSVNPAESPHAYGAGSWQIDLRLNSPNAPPYLLRLDSQLGFAETISGNADLVTANVAMEWNIWRLPTERDMIQVAPSIRAPLNRASIEGRSQRFDIAVVSEVGEVLDISDRSVAWRGSDAVGPLFLVVFRRPVARMSGDALDTPVRLNLLSQAAERGY